MIYYAKQILLFGHVLYLSQVETQMKKFIIAQGLKSFFFKTSIKIDDAYASSKKQLHVQKPHFAQIWVDLAM